MPIYSIESEIKFKARLFGMDDQISRDIGYIVLPPGHGKSHHHKKLDGLVEADSVFDCRGTEQLHHMRFAARLTGDWSQYDAKWAAMIKDNLPSGRFVVLVPSEKVGMALDGMMLGRAQLSDEQWQLNLSKRGKTCKDYDYARCAGDNVRSFPTNEELSIWLLDLAEAYLNKTWNPSYGRD